MICSWLIIDKLECCSPFFERYFSSIKTMNEKKRKREIEEKKEKEDSGTQCVWLHETVSLS
jgi:hypothetical protein